MLLLTFSAGPNRYAIDVNWVVELVPRVELRSVPHSPVYLSGLLGYRGNVIPVVDLGVLLGSEGCSDRLSTRIILVSERRDARGRPPEGADTPPPASSPVRPLLGLMADQVSELAYVQADSLLPAPVQLAGAPYLGEIVKTDHGIAQLIDIMKLRSTIHF
jgi:chemotaxis-related protein WspB